MNGRVRGEMSLMFRNITFSKITIFMFVMLTEFFLVLYSFLNMLREATISVSQMG